MQKFFDSFTLSQFAVYSDAQEQEVKQRRAFDAQKFYERAGVPKRYFHESFKTFETNTTERKELFGVVKSFLQEVKQGKWRTLVLIGNAGTGKTHLASAAIREILQTEIENEYSFYVSEKQYMSAHYYESFDIVDRLRSAQSFSSAVTPAKVIETLVKRDLTVIDEIGRAKSEDEKRELFRVFNALYNNCRSSILIGNFANKKSFYEYVGGAFVDRLSESGVVYETKGRSYRFDKNNDKKSDIESYTEK